MKILPLVRNSALRFLPLFIVAAVHADPMMIYMSPDGDDAKDGRSDTSALGDAVHGPVRSLAGVQTVIRKLRASGSIPSDGLVVEIASGRYVMDKPISLGSDDSGSSKTPIIYRAQEAGKAIFSGSAPLPPGQALSDPVALDLVRPDARDHIIQIDLHSFFPGPVPGFASGGNGFVGVEDHPICIFQDNQRLPYSRWPQKGYAKTGMYYGNAVGTGLAQYYSSGKFQFESDRLAQWAKEPDLWMYGVWFVEWADESMKVGSINLTEKSVQLAEPNRYSFGFKPGQDFNVFNAISEIDRPGEWAVDRTKKMLFIWPKEDPAKAPLELAVAPKLVVGDGASNIRFEGIVFEGARDTAFDFVNSNNIVVQGCTVRHLGGWGVKMNGRNCSVIGSDLYDLGEGGVSLAGGDLRTLTRSNNMVENCHIYDFGIIVAMYQPAVNVGGIGGIVCHNLIHDGAHAAILFQGNEQLIEYNIIHDVCQHSSDVGAIYGCTRDWSQRGNVIRYNVIHALLPVGDTKNARRGIYLDDYTSGVEVYGNIVTMASAGLHLGGGKDVSMTNNLILFCPTSIEYSSRGIDSFDAADDLKGRNSSIFRNTLASYYNTPIWRERYPKIMPEMQGDPIKVHDAAYNTITNNIFACGGGVQIDNAKNVMKTSVVSHNAIIDGDPGLMDPGTLDFRFKPDAIGPTKVATWLPLPVEKMGLYADPDRASPAVRFGPEVTPLPPLVSRLEASRTHRHVAMIMVPKGQVTIDGDATPNEWNTSLENAIVCSVPEVEKTSTYSSKAWAASDGEALLLYVVIDRDPSVPLVETGKWGERDAFEIALRNPSDPSVPTGLIHCYPDGTFARVPVKWGDEKWAADLQQKVSYAAKVQSHRWTAEIRIPFGPFQIRPDDQIFFNLNVRRMSDGTWMEWSDSPQGISDLDEAGVLVPQQK